ncbi:hypothetical protein [Microseira wollei]|uniref:hypothetical protein n=1 Tax=Microseira wollei TaxID=467598 RepID=UPI001CFF2609|nr:hypothetical protein [Microseira wollei]
MWLLLDLDCRMSLLWRMASSRQVLYICRAASNLDNKMPSIAELTMRGSSVTNQGVVLGEVFGTSRLIVQRLI